MYMKHNNSHAVFSLSTFIQAKKVKTCEKYFHTYFFFFSWKYRTTYINFRCAHSVSIMIHFSWHNIKPTAMNIKSVELKTKRREKNVKAKWEKENEQIISKLFYYEKWIWRIENQENHNKGGKCGREWKWSARANIVLRYGAMWCGFNKRDRERES